MGPVIVLLRASVVVGWVGILAACVCSIVVPVPAGSPSCAFDSDWLDRLASICDIVPPALLVDLFFFVGCWANTAEPISSESANEKSGVFIASDLGSLL